MSDSQAPSAPQSGVSIWFLLVTALFVTCLVTANIIAVKAIEIPLYFLGRPVGALVLPAAIIIFPVSYILGDVLTEVYGYRQSRRVIWLGFLCNLVVVAAVAVAQALPAAPFWDAQPAFERILGSTPRILVASFIAYLFGEFANAFVLAKMKLATQGRWLWTRTIGSTLVGQALDSAIFITLAFAGEWPTGLLITAVVTQWLVKSAYEALATPVTYAVVFFLKRADRVDVYDRETRFNPLLVAD